MAKRVSKLKQFAKQYGHCWIAGYLYVECPRPQFELFKEARWTPDTEHMAAVQSGINKRARFVDYAYFYNKIEQKYYVIDHLWIASLAAWGNDEMRDYTRIAFSRMLSKLWEQPKVVKAESHAEFALVVDVVDEEGNSVKQKESATTKTAKAKPKQLSLLEEQVKAEDFLVKYGISQSVYDNMKKDSHIVDTKEGGLHILDICKFLYKVEQVKMKDIYAKLKELKIVSQPPIDMGGQHEIYLSNEWKDDKRGFNMHKKSTIYPVFYDKGIIMLGMVLHDHGVISKYILPAL